jgi:hypothetical protein
MLAIVRAVLGCLNFSLYLLILQVIYRVDYFIAAVHEDMFNNIVL